MENNTAESLPHILSLHFPFHPLLQYEFKAKAIKKRKIIFTVSVDGVFVNLRKSRKVSSRAEMGGGGGREGAGDGEKEEIIAGSVVNRTKTLKKKVATRRSFFE